MIDPFDRVRSRKKAVEYVSRSLRRLVYLMNLDSDIAKESNDAAMIVDDDVLVLRQRPPSTLLIFLVKSYISMSTQSF